jgi:purine-nucleoside phosphorylase
MPENRNMFAMNTGSGTAKGLLAFVVMFGGTVASVPIYVAAFFAPSGVELLLGIGWGILVAAGGVAIGGLHLRDRGPELLLAVTPRR